MDYSYQAVETGTGTLVTWTSPTPDLTGAGSGTTVDAGSVVQTNWPGPADGTNGFAWSGVGITGSVQPEDVVLGAGLNGAWDLPTATLTLTGRSILDVYDAAGGGTLISENVERIYLNGLTGTHLLPGMMVISASQAVMHAPVVGVTCGNLAPSTGGLELPTSYTTSVANADFDEDLLTETARVLVAFQTTDPTENGIYVVTSGELVKSAELVSLGHMIPVQTGRVWAGTIWAYSGTDTYTPPPGAATSSAWAEIEPAAAVGWVAIAELIHASGIEAYQWHLHVDVTATYCEYVESGMPITRVCKTSAVYQGNPSGDMIPIGDPLTFGLPYEADGDVRLRASVNGNLLDIEAYRDATGGDNRTYRYRLEITTSLKQVVT